LCLEDDAVVGELLDDGQQARVEEAHLEQDQERQRAVDPVRQRVEDRECEVQAENQLDDRLDDVRLPVALADPLVRVVLDAVWRARELGLFTASPRTRRGR
jgi:hypothetical protein